MKKPLSISIREVWSLFLDNLVLLVPAAAVWFISLAFYGLIALVFFLTCWRSFKELLSGVQGFSDLSFSELWGWAVSGAVYLIGMAAVAVMFQIALSILHGAGWGRMFERAAARGKTGLGDYFEGIARFSGRMFWYAMLRGGILGLPLTALMVFVTAAVAAGAYQAAVLIAIAGVFGVIFSTMAISFVTWMWKPAMFVRDIGAMEGMYAGFRFTMKRLGGLVVIWLLWFGFSMTIGMLFSAVALPVQFMMGQEGPAGAKATLFAVGVGIRMLNSLVAMLMSVYFVLFLFKYYSDEWREVDLPSESEPPAGEQTEQISQETAPPENDSPGTAPESDPLPPGN